MTQALIALLLGNIGFGIWSHRSLGGSIQKTRDDLTFILTGVARQEGPVLAQVVAERAKRPAVKSAALNL